MTEFKVVFDGIELTEEQSRAINTAIQQAVLSQLSAIDFGSERRDAEARDIPQVGERGPQARPLVVTPRWLGITFAGQ